MLDFQWSIWAPRDKGIWEKLLEMLIDEADDEWLMIDDSYCKVHSHAANVKEDNQDMKRTKKVLKQNCM